MHNYISRFLDDVCEQIKYKNTHEHVSEELQCHISELTDKYIENGMDENEAVKKAVKQMGDPVDIGKKLDKIHRPKTEWSIISLIGVIILIGGVALFSIANEGFLMMGLHQLIRYAIYILLGIGICVFFYFFDYTKLEKYSLHIFIGGIVFLFVSTKFGLKLNGVSYIKIGTFSFAVAPIVLPLFFISFSGLANKWVTGNIRHIFKLFGLAAIAAILSYFIQPSFSIFTLLIAGFLVIITIAIMGKTFKGNRKKFLLSIYGFLTTSFLLVLMNVIWKKPYIKARLLTFLNPGLDPDGAGYINVVLAKLLSTAKLLGKNDNLYLNFEGAKTLALPEASTDFIFTYIISAFGWLAGIIIVLIITSVVVRMFLATRRINHQYGRCLAGSIITTFTIQALANILMNLGLFPITGFSLPLVSYGGTNFIMNMVLIGLLLGIYRRKDLVMVSKEYI